MAAPREILDLVERFQDNADEYLSGRYNETMVPQDFINPFCECLRWDMDNRRGYAEAYRDVIHEDAIKVGGATKEPDYCFRIGGTRKFLLEAKKPSVNLKTNPAYQPRRYAWSAELPLSILTDFHEFAVTDANMNKLFRDRINLEHEMAKRLSSVAVVALKEALCSVYWYKADLRSFLQSAISEKSLVSGLNWSNYKRQIVSDLVDELCSKSDRYLADLTRLCQEVCKIQSFKHLEQLDGGEAKAQRANEAVKQLRNLVETHDKIEEEDKAIAQRQRRHADKLKANTAVREKLKDINSRYFQLVTSTEPQQRGFELEKLMYDLFELFDLDPKASFKVTGEQIDGAFSLDGTDYLFEAKWQQEPSGGLQLDGFASKVQRRLDNTLGVFLSINGFSDEGVAAHSRGRPSIILMDGADLMAVLEERIDFVSLLVRKRRHGSHTGNIYLRIHEIV